MTYFGLAGSYLVDLEFGKHSGFGRESVFGIVE